MLWPFVFFSKGIWRGVNFNSGVSEKFLCIRCLSWATYSSLPNLSRRNRLDILRDPFQPQYFCDSAVFPIWSYQEDILGTIVWKRIVGLSHDGLVRSPKP